MNLVKIEHWRCGEPDGITWCFAPEDWAAEQVDEAIRRARDAYQQAVDDYRQAGEDEGYGPSWYFREPSYSDYPDLTVKEVRAQWEAKKKEWEEAKARYNAALRRFADFLSDEGFVEFYDAQPFFERELHWGHQHGTPLDYDQKSPSQLDKQGAASTKDHW